MVQLDLVRSANASLIDSHPLTAVFPGGTSGIGDYTIRALATRHGKSKSQNGLRVYIIGRNATAAAKNIADYQRLSPGADFIFVQAADLSLLKDVDQSCEEVIRLERQRAGADPSIDLLVMSHADLHFGARRETSEGIDKTMSLLYYSRMRFITKLLPLLSSSRLPRGARVISVYGAGLEKGLPRWFPDDLSLRVPSHYSLMAYRTHVPVMTTFFFEKLAKENEKIGLAHIFPSLVITPAFYSSSHPWWFRLAFALLGPFLRAFVAVGAEETGDRVLFLTSERYRAKQTSAHGIAQDSRDGLPTALATDCVRGGGAYSLDHKGETNDIEEVYATLRKEDFGRNVEEHTLAAFHAVDSGEVFKG